MVCHCLCVCVNSLSACKHFIFSYSNVFAAWALFICISYSLLLSIFLFRAKKGKEWMNEWMEKKHIYIYIISTNPSARMRAWALLLWILLSNYYYMLIWTEKTISYFIWVTLKETSKEHNWIRRKDDKRKRYLSGEKGRERAVGCSSIKTTTTKNINNHS